MTTRIYYLLKTVLLGIILISFVVACGDDDDDINLGNMPDNELLSAAIENYADVVLANYIEALSKTQDLKTTVDNFVDNPSEANLNAAKDAWLEAREPYGQSEAFRFYGGPIDDEDGPEGQLNAWPLDESYIDAVVGATNGDNPADNDGTNIINSPDLFPTIDKALITSLNEQGSETNVSAGYHAVEFLLWGQDVSEGPGGGERPFTDYVTDGSGTKDNQERRAQYLQAATDLLIDDLQSLVNEWSEGGSFRTFFTSEDELNNSLEKILNGIGKLSKGELAGERMFVAWDLRSKEDEHSCFSDNTHRDIVNNALGIQNVYLGRFGSIDGPGIDEVIATVNPTLADEIGDLMVSSVAATQEIEAPFDQEFLAEPGRTRIKNAIDLLREQGDKIAEAAAEFGFTFDPDDI